MGDVAAPQRATRAARRGHVQARRAPVDDRAAAAELAAPKRGQVPRRLRQQQASPASSCSLPIAAQSLTAPHMFTFCDIAAITGRAKITT